jgi:hypothetical protein
MWLAPPASLATFAIWSRAFVPCLFYEEKHFRERSACGVMESAHVTDGKIVLYLMQLN